MGWVTLVLWGLSREQISALCRLQFCAFFGVWIPVCVLAQVWIHVHSKFYVSLSLQFLESILQLCSLKFLERAKILPWLLTHLLYLTRRNLRATKSGGMSQWDLRTFLVHRKLALEVMCYFRVFLMKDQVMLLNDSNRYGHTRFPGRLFRFHCRLGRSLHTIGYLTESPLLLMGGTLLVLGRLLMLCSRWDELVSKRNQICLLSHFINYLTE